MMVVSLRQVRLHNVQWGRSGSPTQESRGSAKTLLRDDAVRQWSNNNIRNDRLGRDAELNDNYRGE